MLYVCTKNTSVQRIYHLHMYIYIYMYISGPRGLASSRHPVFTPPVPLDGCLFTRPRIHPLGSYAFVLSLFVYLLLFYPLGSYVYLTDVRYLTCTWQAGGRLTRRQAPVHARSLISRGTKGIPSKGV